MGPDVPADHALPCRPTIACTADIVAPGAFEVEAGVLYRRLAARVDQWTTPLLLKQSFTRMFQLQVGTNGFTAATGPAKARFLDDVVVGPKLHLVDQATYTPSVALSAALSVPTFRATGYLRTYDVLGTGYVTKDFAFVHADWNVGANALRIDGKAKWQPFSALALSVPLPATFGAMVEGYVFASAPPIAKRDGGILFALSESPREWLVFDVGGDVGLFPTTRSYAVFVGMTFVPAVLGH